MPAAATGGRGVVRLDVVRSGWSRAVDHYAEIVAAEGWPGAHPFANRLDRVGLGEMVGEGDRPLKRRPRSPPCVRGKEP